MTGKKFAHYNILRPLGKGGMGEVYLAEDTRLKREVAIKVLPERLRSNQERLRRFRREAEAAASLKHPNIATIYALEEFDGEMFITMEYVEGKPLKDVIPDGGMEVADSDAAGRTQGSSLHFFDVFLPLADALAHAHGEGRIHRDIKPGNIMIAADGTPKILDFGLARIIDPDPVQATEESEAKPELGPDDRTRTMDEEEQRKAAEADKKAVPSLTRGGQLIGTPQYMSPEQAEREETDARTDIFSFGVVMYEALTGQRPFEGKTVESIIGRIVEAEPQPVTELKPVTPYTLWEVIKRTLRKDRTTRTQTAHELLVDLQEVQQSIQSGITLIDASHSAFFPRSIKAVSFAVLMALFMATLAWFLKPVPPVAEVPLRKFEIEVEGNASGSAVHPVISPDGEKLAYVSGGELWIRDLDQVEPRRIEDGTGAVFPFWSPDSEELGYYVGNLLKKVSVHGGRSTQISSNPINSTTQGATWYNDGTIVFSTTYANNLYQVPAGGGNASVYLEPDSSLGEVGFYSPKHLPDGSLVFITRIQDGTGALTVLTDGHRRYILRCDTTEAFATPPWYASPDHLIYVLQRTGTSQVERPGELWALPFSLSTLESSGDPLLIAHSVSSPSVSDEGTLVYERVNEESLQQLVWVNRRGDVEEKIGQPQLMINFPEISPDHERIVVSAVYQGNEDIWVHDARNRNQNPVRLTFDSYGDFKPIWSPGGDQVSYFHQGEGTFIRKSDGSESPETLVISGIANDWSKDGRYLLSHTGGRNRDIKYFPFFGDSTSVSILDTDANEALPRLSPDGRYMAYISDESGIWEVYVTRFPSGEGKWQVSVNGGVHPKWSNRNDELFFVTGNTLMVASIDTRSGFRPGSPRPLFTGEQVGTRLYDGGNPTYPLYDVSSDGQRFVVVQDVGERRATIVLTQNWIKAFEEGN